MRRTLAVLLSVGLIVSAGSGTASRVFGAPDPINAQELQGYLDKSYQELFDLAPTLNIEASAFARLGALLDKAEQTCVGRFEKQEKQAAKQVKDAEKRLRQDTGTLSPPERQARHCEVEHLRAQREQIRMLAKHAVPLAYRNRAAKLALLRDWPRDLAEIRRSIADGSAHAREHGDVADIGVREVGRNQEKDVEVGRQAVEEMRQANVMPPPVDSELIQSYVRTLGERIAARSDLRVPVQVEVLDSPEVNAFALPGGFLFVHRGLLERADDEAQLAGVLSHEIAHAAARHGDRMMRRAAWSSLLFQAAQIGTSVLTGGISSIGAYYAYQYGFTGLGLLMSLDLLGVSRDFELEADQLGVQYAWNAGYDPSGFVRFFDKMATTEGHVNGSSWFRTHPPFYERMLKSQREVMYLPSKDDLVVTSPEFHGMKEELAQVVAASPPSPGTLAGRCPAPEKLEYDAAQPAKGLCP
ncbi:MAG: M48 family metalloprotease [Acidobacteria bacterium]|nr:M48 family metalloprotease [Acidobacteriota bacterium]